MTQKLEELFNVPPAEEKTENKDTESTAGAKPSIDEQRTVIKEVDNAIDKIDSALPFVNDLDTSDKELDDLSDLAKDKFQDLMDLGMNVEARYAGKIFEVAGTMMKNAIDARSAKVDKKLRMVELQIKKQRVDQQEQSAGGPLEIEAEATIVADRNELIRQILDKGKDNADKK